LKRVHIVGHAYSSDFFDVSIEDTEMTLMPYIEVDPYHIAKFGFKMDDDGLKGIGINEGDFILVSDYSLEPVFDQAVVIRQDGKFLVRVSHIVNPIEGVFVTSPNDNNPIQLLSENYRIIGVVTGVVPGTKPLHHPYDEYHSEF
jgi:hypothetical protein